MGYAPHVAGRAGSQSLRVSLSLIEILRARSPPSNVQVALSLIQHRRHDSSLFISITGAMVQV